VAEWLRNGLQNRVPRFNSGRGLHNLLNGLAEIFSGPFLAPFWLLGTRWEPGWRIFLLRPPPLAYRVLKIDA
jgi:hypothetical protein